jgi:hypothetical protein
LDIIKRGFANVKITMPDKSHGKRMTEDFLNMAMAYCLDAETFFKNRDCVNTSACMNYVHGWLDVGVRIGLFDAGRDDQLFMIAL